MPIFQQERPCRSLRRPSDQKLSRKTTLEGIFMPGISQLDERLRTHVYPSDVSKWRCPRQRRGRTRFNLTTGIEKARVVSSELLISFTTICPLLWVNVYVMIMYYDSASCFLFSLPCSVTLGDESLAQREVEDDSHLVHSVEYIVEEKLYCVFAKDTQF